MARIVSLLFVLSACGDLPVVPETTLEPEVSVQRVRAGLGAGASTYVGLHVLVTGEDGVPIPCSEGTLDVSVAVSTDGADGPWTELDHPTLTCVGAGEGDLALVLDNSGSETGWGDEVAAGASNMVGGVLGGGGRSSLVRVSTNATVLTGVTDDAEALAAAIDGAVVADGWTALWDGLRMANETLGGAVIADGGGDPFASQEDFCASTDRLGLVVFTDGRENNSADEQDYDHVKYPGDGLDTTLEDVANLHVGGATTPIYAIGLGNDVDVDGLQSLADSSGGRFLHIASSDEIEGVFDLVSDYLASTSKVCATLDEETCGPIHVKVTWSWTPPVDSGLSALAGEDIAAIDVDCPHDATGNMATILLTLTNPFLPVATAEALTRDTLAWVSPVEDPEVLVVLDDNHHNEFRGDAAWVAETLAASGYSVDYLEEDADGINASDIDGYDVVWYSNPGYPPDELASIEALEAFTAMGGAVVLQGDDMAWSWGNAFPMSGLTHLDFMSNGTSVCGVWTDNNAGAEYAVSYASGHPVVATVGGTSHLYGDDIDETTARNEGEVVLATAQLDGRPDCGTRPVVVGWTP
jgi:hypothetical protein